MYCIIFGNTFVNLSGNPHPAPSPFSFAKVGLFEPYAVSEPSLNNKLKFFAEIDRKFQRVLKWDGYTLMLQMNSGTQNLSSPLSLYMGFSDETEVAMITIDEATASRDYTQRRYWFAFLIKFDNFSRALTAKKPAEKCAAPLRVLVLCWAYYYLSMESNSWYATISLEKIDDLIENAQQNWRPQVPTVQRPALKQPFGPCSAFVVFTCTIYTDTTCSEHSL